MNITCIFCHQNLIDVSIGSISASGTCPKCKSWLMFEEQELSAIEIKSPSTSNSCWVRSWENNIVLESEYWEISVPLTWVFPDTVDSLIERYNHLLIFL